MHTFPACCCPAAAEYTTPGVAFEELNQRLYEASTAAKLEEMYEEVMEKKSNSNSASGSVSIAAIDSSVSRSTNVAKSSKVAAYLVLGLLMRGRALV